MEQGPSALSEKVTLAVVVDRLDNLRHLLDKMDARQESQFNAMNTRLDAVVQRVVSLETSRALLTAWIGPAWAVSLLLATAVVSTVLRVAFAAGGGGG